MRSVSPASPSSQPVIIAVGKFTPTHKQLIAIPMAVDSAVALNKMLEASFAPSPADDDYQATAAAYFGFADDAPSFDENGEPCANPDDLRFAVRFSDYAEGSIEDDHDFIRFGGS